MEETTTSSTLEPTTSTTTTTAPPCEGECPPDDWRNTAELDPWADPTTTTSTTAPPCTGYCTWTYDSVTTEYTLVGRGCTGACDCYYPTICLPNGCTNVKTACVAGAPSDHGNPPNCTGTTSAPTSCGPPCQWTYYPILGWVLVNPEICVSPCTCPSPSGIEVDCEDQYTNCTNRTGPGGGGCSGCYGWCGYRQVSDGAEPWEVYGSCGGSSDVNECYCPDAPSGPVREWSLDECGRVVVFTGCSIDCDGTGGGTPGLPPPGVCLGLCYYCWDGTQWNFARNECVGCTCAQPGYDGENAGEVGLVPCQTGTSTSSTTTSTAPPCSTTTCGWICEHEEGCGLPGFDWTLWFDTGCHSEECGCVYPTGHAGEFGESLAWYCGTEGTTLGPTTTTTTAEPCTQNCSWHCNGASVCDGSLDNPWTLTGDGCIGGDDCGCPHPVVMVFGPADINWPCSTACQGRCRWRCDQPGNCSGLPPDGEWTLVTDTCNQGAGGCGCTQPVELGLYEAVIERACATTTTTAPPTTTTAEPTTTTAPPTTTTAEPTTTTAPPCGTCDFVCTGSEWVQSANNCTGGCICTPPGGSCIDEATAQTSCEPPI